MSFKPLGYHFEINSHLSPQELRRQLRENKNRWFQAKDGPRGWIVGPFMCLWSSALDRYGPMVLARISPNNFGTKISGRAGADLNGTLLFILITPFMAWLTWKMHDSGQGSFRLFLVVGVIFGLGLPLTLWVNSSDRSHADPLVNFIRKVAGATEVNTRS